MKQTTFVTDLGKRAREARKARGWTQKQAAEAIGLSLRRYGDIERGEAVNVTSETIEAITRNLLLTESRTTDITSAPQPEAIRTDANRKTKPLIAVRPVIGGRVGPVWFTVPASAIDVVDTLELFVAIDDARALAEPNADDAEGDTESIEESS
ncbi:MAG: helix-turn-helix transcriptional regulator [bacterium]|nr:helix-turn-helix transcriptional regulator [bacterium]